MRILWRVKLRLSQSMPNQIPNAKRKTYATMTPVVRMTPTHTCHSMSRIETSRARLLPAAPCLAASACSVVPFWRYVNQATTLARCGPTCEVGSDNIGGAWGGAASSCGRGKLGVRATVGAAAIVVPADGSKERCTREATSCASTRRGSVGGPGTAAAPAKGPAAQLAGEYSCQS